MVKFGIDSNMVFDANGKSVAARLSDHDTSLDGLTTSLADITSKTGWINPDKYSGTDVQKLQSALNDGDVGYKEIVLTRQYDITGNTLYVNRSLYGDARYIRISGLNGGITKNDGGFIFTSNNTGGLYTERFNVRNIKFVSVEGVGTKVFNFDKLIEVVATNNQYVNVDCVAFSSGNNAQSPRFINENINGGKGYAFDFVNTYDCVIDNCIAEHREAFFIQRSSTPINGNVNPNGFGSNALRITNNLIEGLSGSMPVIKLGFTSVGLISGNYFETNVGVDIDLSQNPGYGITVENNFIHSTDVNKTCILLPSVAVLADDNTDQYVFISNHVRGGSSMFDFGTTPDPNIKIISIGNYCNGGTFIKNHSELFDTMISLSKTKTTTTGSTTFVNKNGVKKYNIQFDDAGVNNGATKACVVDIGYTVSTTSLINIRIKQSTDGATPYPSDINLYLSDISINSADTTKLNFTVHNNTVNWRRTYFDINIVDF